MTYHKTALGAEVALDVNNYLGKSTGYDRGQFCIYLNNNIISSEHMLRSILLMGVVIFFLIVFIDKPYTKLKLR